VNCQAESEVLEQYALGGLPEEESGEIEAHLLVCDACRKDLLETEAYVEAMRSAARQLRQRGRVRTGWLQQVMVYWQPFSAAAAAMVILAVVAGGPWRAGKTSESAPLPVVLQASRGADGAQVPAGRPLVLTMDMTELPAFATYRVEVVNAVGTKIAEFNASPVDGTLRAPTGAGLDSGVYFVRLYSPEDQLLREYALEIRTPAASTSR
jgi:Putative zinc-finger